MDEHKQGDNTFNGKTAREENQHNDVVRADANQQLAEQPKNTKPGEAGYPGNPGNPILGRDVDVKGKDGRPAVRSVDGEIVARGSGKCPTCGRDHANTGDGYEANGQPVLKDAAGVRVRTNAAGFPDKPVVSPVAK